jgi:hypothetical protein
MNTQKIGMEDQYDWTYLHALVGWMWSYDSPFRFLILDQEQALKNALLSGDVPMRGKPRFHSEYQRIEKYIDAATDFLLGANSVWIRSSTFESVQADKISLQRWLRANAIENQTIEDQTQTPVAAAEARIRKWLREQPETPLVRRDDVFRSAISGQLIGEIGRKLAYRAFLRAWAQEAPETWRRPGRRKSTSIYRLLPGAEIETPR